MKVKLTEYLDVPPERHTEVLAALPQHIALTRAEPGCIDFNVIESADVAGRLLVSELFADRMAFDAHQSRTRASAWAETSQGIPRQYEITEVPE